MKKLLRWTVISILLAGNLFAGVSTIEDLDEACEFKFAIFSDNRGEMDENSANALAWIKANDDFCIGLGDLFDGNSTKDNAFQNLWKNDSYYHNNLYPTFGNHCNRINGGSQVNWGRPYFTLNNLDTSDWEFRSPTSEKIWGFTTMDNHTLKAYDDRKIDYYVKKTFGAFNVHLIVVYKSDHTPFARRSAQFMLDKLTELNVNKTDHDIIVLLGHEERWLTRACTTDGDFDGPMTRGEVEFCFEHSDIVVGASDHQFRRMNNIDDWGLTNPAIYIDSGQVYNTDDADGYCDFHVFDNPPRVTCQYIDCDRSTRVLHTGRANDGAISIKSGHTTDSQYPMMKYIDGAFVQPLDWNSFTVIAPANLSDYISQNVPSYMIPGETRQVSVTLKNTGDDDWSTSTGHKLGSVGDDPTWTGASRVQLPNDVSTNSQVTFTFEITAPLTPGKYDFQWQMVDDSGDNIGWFGDATPLVSIPVGIVETSIAASDDAEESMTSGSVLVNSIDLDFLQDEDDLDPQSVGIRFSGLPLAGGETITRAYIQFTGNQAPGNTDPCNVIINAEDIDNSAAFNSSANNITARPRTSASVNWAMSAGWNGDAGNDEKSPDLAALISEVTSRPGWQQGNAISFVFTGSGGIRRAESCNSPDGGAPVLHLEYELSDIPIVFGSTPAASETGVSIATTQISIDFSQPMNASSVASNIAIAGTGVSGLNYVSGDGSGLIVFDIAGALQENTTYTVSIGTGAQSADGFALDAPYMFSFATTGGLVKNGSFEDGANFWSVGSASSISTEQTQDGGSSLKMTDGASNTRQTVSLQPNTDYELRVWVLAPGLTSGGVRFDTLDKFDSATGPSGPGGTCQFNIDAGDAQTWTKYTGTFNSSNETEVVLRTYQIEMVGTAYFDHVTLTAIGGANNAPEITSTPATTVDQDAAYSYTLEAEDMDGDLLTFSSVTVPAGLIFDSGTRVLSGSLATAGEYAVALRVSDGQGGSADQSFSITVESTVDGYDAWVADNGIIGNPTDDDDGDGLDNLSEYAVGERPVLVKGTGQFEYQFKRRLDDPNLSYKVQTCTDLTSGSWADVLDVPTVTGNDGTYESLTQTIPVDDSQMYIRLRIEN